MSDDDWLDEHVELYAIDGLPVEERRRVAEELAGLPAARREEYDARIVETQETIADYASRYAVNAPEQVRRQVLADFERRVPTATGAAESSPRPRHARPEVVTPITSSHRWRRVAAFVAAAAVVVAAAIGGGVLIGRATAPTSQSTQADGVAAVLSAPDAAVANGRLSDGRGNIVVVTSRQRNQAVALLRGGTAVPTDRSLQLWLVGKKASPVSAGIVDSASAPPVLIDQVDGSAVLAVTLEPRGGSSAPTTPLLTEVRL
ncbi:anti-sigma factor [Gordonia sp. TBRC 11910]|uniref:Regulator of SigK n=1 Tax=Gordonia asplenii TaxID=2725283 RepID=A0A848KPF7_9ACTN|nr:anti-sigma factor [Gordonia asplenii]NMO00122.1 anti-sigma factor [Gordonia asplenii]